MQSLEDKIFEYSADLSNIKQFDSNFTSTLALDKGFCIKASHAEIENNEWVYNIVLLENEDKVIDSVYCDNTQENIEDIIIFLIEEYK